MNWRAAERFDWGKAKEGMVRVRTKFAFLPTRVDSPTPLWIWFEAYEVHEALIVACLDSPFDTYWKWCEVVGSRRSRRSDRQRERSGESK